MLTLITVKPDKKGAVNVASATQANSAHEFEKPIRLLNRQGGLGYGIWDGEELVTYRIAKDCPNIDAVRETLIHYVSKVPLSQVS